MIQKNNSDNLEQLKEENKRESALSLEIQKLLLRQLKHELQNHNIYMSFANYFGIRGFVILEEYYKLRADEEYLHHSWIRTYLNENDVAYSYPTIEAFNKKIESMEAPFDITVSLEELTTKMIDEIIEQAVNEGDWGTFNWLMGHDKEKGMLRDEQVNLLPGCIVICS